MKIYDNVVSGEYDNKLPFPSKPPMPEVLRKKAFELTAEEAASLTVAKDRYLEEVEEVMRQKQAYYDENKRVMKRFREDLENEFGTKGHPKADKIFNMAWDKGHSSGYHEVVYEYEELAELIT